MELLSEVTEDARELLIHAQDEARSLSNGYIGTEHLLVAAIRDPGSPVTRRLVEAGASPDVVRSEISRLAAENNWTKYVTPEEALAEAGVDLAAVRQQVEAEFGEGTLPMRLGAPPFTARSRSLIENAIMDARSAGRDRATSDDIVVAILRDGHSVAAKILQSSGLDITAFLAGLS